MTIEEIKKSLHKKNLTDNEKRTILKEMERIESECPYDAEKARELARRFSLSFEDRFRQFTI